MRDRSNKMSKKSELLHTITINFLEDLKPEIYTTDPIPKPKFSKEGDMVFCPYCSYPKNHFYVGKKELYGHLKSESHLKRFTKHHLPILRQKEFEKIQFILNNLDSDDLESYLGVSMEMLYLKLTV